MTRHLERPGEGHALRSMTLEGLDAVMEHARNALLQARDEDDLRLARLYARQQDRAAAEMLARRLERQQHDRDARALDPWPEAPDTGPRSLDEKHRPEREVGQYRLAYYEGAITREQYEAAVQRLRDTT